MSNKSKGNIALLITAFVWGTGFIAQKFGNDILPPMAFNAIRQFFAAIVLCPVMALSLKKSGYLEKDKVSVQEISQRKKAAIKGGFICGLFLLGGSVAQQVGLLTVSAGKCGFITALYIVITPFFSIILGKKVHLKTFVCVIIAIVGFGFLSLRGGLGGATIGDWLSLFGAFCFAAQIVAVNYYVDEGNDIIISVLQMAFCGIIGLTLSLIFEHPAMADIIKCMPVILYSTFIPTAMGFTLQIVGQKYTDSTSASLIMSLESVFSVILGALVLHEYMEPMELFGCLLIFAAVILDQLDFKKELKK